MLIHHSLSKNATDKALSNWKHSIWSNSTISTDVYQTIAAQTFPSPDSMLFDPTGSRSIALEFKPQTETKRGILTGVGQAIAYLQSASMAYLIAPERLEGYNLSGYLKDLYTRTIYGKLPIGLITYSDDEAKEISLIVDIASGIELTAATAGSQVGRYWAKHVDMPLHALWIILDLAYQSRQDVDNRIEYIWHEFFSQYLFPPAHRTTLDIYPTQIVKHDGTRLFIFDKTKRKLQAQVEQGQVSYGLALQELSAKASPETPGDNYYKSYKKNFLPFIKHLTLWDDNGNLTEDGLFLHRMGKIHSPTSETFKNYFAKILLFNGKHLDLILDVESMTRNKGFNVVDEALDSILSQYVESGLFKPSPGSVTAGTGKFLKYERIIWGQLGLLNKESNTQFIPNRGFLFNWGKITKLCSLE